MVPIAEPEIELLPTRPTSRISRSRSRSANKYAVGNWKKAHAPERLLE